jgi:hypothetical protein
MKNPTKPNKHSPLYTPPPQRTAKKEIIQAKGKDSDGAFRAFNRIHSKKDKQ